MYCLWFVVGVMTGVCVVGVVVVVKRDGYVWGRR